MSLRLILDEDTLDESLRDSIRRNNEDRPEYAIDIVRVGDAGGPPRGTHDRDLILWSIDHGRIIVSQDNNTLIGYFKEIVASGKDAPGLLLVRRGVLTVNDLAEHLMLVANAGHDSDYRNQYDWIP